MAPRKAVPRKAVPLGPVIDPELDRVKAWFEARPNFKEEFGLSIRTALDEVIDTARTRRVSFNECDQVEQRYMGFKVEHVIQGQFELKRGQRMDYSVDGVDVDCKWSKHYEEWTIPKEALGHICLGVWANDDTSEFAVGLIRIRDEILRKGRNQDKKRSILSGYRHEITYLVPKTPSLPENFLLHLPIGDRTAIMSHSGGDERLMALFTRCQGVIIRRHTIESVGQQIDAARRARAARPHLHALGLELLNGHRKADKALAAKLGGPIPQNGSEWVCLPKRRPNLGRKSDPSE